MKGIKKHVDMCIARCIKEQYAWSTAIYANIDTHLGAVHTAHIKEVGNTHENQ